MGPWITAISVIVVETSSNSRYLPLGGSLKAQLTLDPQPGHLVTTPCEGRQKAVLKEAAS